MPNIVTRIYNFVQRLLLHSSRYRWYVFTPRVSRATIAPLLADGRESASCGGESAAGYRQYAAGGPLMERTEVAAGSTADGAWRRVPQRQLDANRCLTAKRVVYLCDGRTVAGGLADRFKGLLSVYALCREAGYEFRMCYTSPFALADYLEPAGYDWRIGPDELNPSAAAMLVLENTDDSDYQTRRQAEWLRRRMAEGPQEMHVITNSNYAYTLDYADLFRQLFRPSPRLAAALQAERERLGQYVTVNARFLTKLGDFRETDGGTALPAAEARSLIERCMAQIAALHDRHPHHVVLVNSDSMRFLAEAQRLPYVRVVEGRVAHTDLMAREGVEDAHMKLFLDFLLIAQADAIYLLHTPPMRISGFPYAASRLAGREMRVIEF